MWQFLFPNASRSLVWKMGGCFLVRWLKCLSAVVDGCGGGLGPADGL